MSLATPLKIGLGIVLLLTVVSIAFAEAKTQNLAFKGPRGSFNGRATYETASAFVGNSSLELTVSLKSPEIDPEKVQLEVTKCESSDEARIQCVPQGPAIPGNFPLERTWKFRISIGAGVEPRPYPLTLTFGYADELRRSLDPNASVDVWSCIQEIQLDVGVTSQGKVRAGDEPSEPPQVLTGTDNQLHVKIVNGFLNYPVRVTSVQVRSTPDWILEKSSTNNTTPVDLSIEPGGTGDIYANFKAAPVGFSSLLTGFGTSKIILDIHYDDGLGRRITDFSVPVTVKVRPRDRILVLAMFVGVLAGTFIKLYLQRLQETGKISRRQAVKFVSATMMIGLVVAVIAMVGKVQIVAFTASGSYDQPLVLFIIALAGALTGAQLLSSWFKKGMEPK